MVGNDPFPTINYMGAMLRTNGSDSSVTTALLNNHYEIYTLKVLDKLIEEARSDAKAPFVFADVGANIGIFTSIAAIQDPHLLIYAFEPDPRSFALLEHNIKLNGLTNATAVNSAVGDSDGIASLDVTSADAGTHSIYGNGNGRIEVPLTSLDNFFFSHDQLPSLIKIDVEGYEPFVLAGLKGIISKSVSLRIILEFHPKWLKRGGRKPCEFLQELEQQFDEIYCLDEVAHRAQRFTPTDAKLESQILTSGFNLLLIKGPTPSFLHMEK